ncbi:MAG: hypothetical protein A2X86_14790 [Bdellovibrionales bacterium GWA2_49_15]|nr:MAG: hypothetical protein A2X86_14790 [Bdellovibrionales bacterium GWA2_49_15]HAZ13392.1 hypothetical protein [Bdellovibrionales bacterium]
MNTKFIAVLALALFLSSLTALASGKKEIEFKFNNTVMLDDGDSYHFLPTILIPIQGLDLYGRQSFLEIGRDNVPVEPVEIQYIPEAGELYNIVMLIRASGEEVQLGRVLVTKEGLATGRGRGYSLIESLGNSKVKLLKMVRSRSASTGFGCGITGCGLGRTKSSRVLLQFSTEAGDQFCLNEGLIKDRPKYFKGRCQD